MYNLILTLYAAVLFVLLSPGTLLRLPPKGSKWAVVFVHVLLFGLVFYFSGNFVASSIGQLVSPRYVPTTMPFLPTTRPIRRKRKQKRRRPTPTPLGVVRG